MKKLFFILFLLISGVAFSQPYTYHLRYDTVKFITANNSEFVLRSSTRDTTNGLLLNIGGGITQFVRIRAISATQFTVGTDTITITGSGGGGGGTYTEGYGIDITSNVVSADTSILGPLWRSQFIPNLIIQNAGTGQQSWWASGDTLYKKRFDNSLGLSWATSADSSLIPTIDSAIWVHKSSTGQITGAKTFTNDINIQRNGASSYFISNRMGTTTSTATGGMQLKDNNTTKHYIWLQNFSDSAWTLKFGQGTAAKSWNIEEKFGHMSLGYSTFPRGYAWDVNHATANYAADSILIMGAIRYRYSNEAGNLLDSFKIDRGANLFSSGNITAEIDSTGTAINMVYQGVDKKLYRAAVPAGGGSSYTFSNGVFESAGAVKSDTALLATRARVRKIVDSLALLIGGGGVAWGGITGTLSSQTDLYNALNSKSPLIKIANSIGSAVKYETFGRDRTQVTQAVTITDGQIRWAAIHIGEAVTLTGVMFYQITTGNFVGDNTNAIALYSYSGGTMTKVAETANSEAIWESTTNTIVSVPFASTYAAAAGTYFVGYLYNASSITTGPTIGGYATWLSTGTNDYTNSAKLMSLLSGQTALPATQAMSGTTANGVPIYFGVY